jgi:hypothetical protein
MKIPDTDGFFLDVSRNQYDAIARDNWSCLRHLKRSPKHYQAALAQKAQDETDALRIGRAVHVATLEPQRFRATYTVWAGDRRAGKEWEKFRADAGPLEILKENEYQLVHAMAEAARSDDFAGKYLRGGAAEATLLWTHEEPADGAIPSLRMECKGRIDMVAHAGSAIIDLKTTRDASPDAFNRQCYSLDTCSQLAMYQDGYAALNAGEVLPVKIVAVENRFPFCVQVYEVPDELLERGRKLYRGLLHTLAYCRFTNSWHGYYDGELELDLPRWARAANDEATTELGLEFEEEQSNAGL